jgi:2-methylisocitrate lyase-like PEP mutase family enzyme
MSQPDQVAAFRRLHEAGCFVMPNPWDVGSARWLRGQGFEALASTSAGFAFTQGRADQAVPRDMMLAHLAELVGAVPDLPVNADFENGYADAPEEVAANVAACVATGVAGLSIEDATGRKADPLYPLPLAVERIRAARAAIDASGSGVLLTARAECFLTGHAEPLAEAVRRIEAYAAAGADVLFVESPQGVDEMRRACDALAGTAPMLANMVEGGKTPILPGAELAALGYRLAIYPNALTRVMARMGQVMLDHLARDGTTQGMWDRMLDHGALWSLFEHERWYAVESRYMAPGPNA